MHNGGFLITGMQLKQRKQGVKNDNPVCSETPPMSSEYPHEVISLHVGEHVKGGRSPDRGTSENGDVITKDKRQATGFEQPEHKQALAVHSKSVTPNRN